MREYIEERTALERELPENSTREMQRELESLEEEFKNLNSKAQNLLKIKKVFEAKLEEMDKNSFKPLIKAFSSNLNKLTAGKYEAGTIDDQFRIELRQNQFKKLPANLELLSYGTYDAAALALRFAIFDNLFQAEGGFIVLDDCLVNLDPKRREKAVQIIKEFQQKYQIIYTTCSPQNAKELGGNIIKV
jgi:exonuclease SbcC